MKSLARNFARYLLLPKLFGSFSFLFWGTREQNCANSFHVCPLSPSSLSYLSFFLSFLLSLCSMQTLFSPFLFSSLFSAQWAEKAIETLHFFIEREERDRALGTQVLLTRTLPLRPRGAKGREAKTDAGLAPPQKTKDPLNAAAATGETHEGSFLSISFYGRRLRALFCLYFSETAILGGIQVSSASEREKVISDLWVEPNVKTFNWGESVSSFVRGNSSENSRERKKAKLSFSPKRFLVIKQKSGEWSISWKNGEKD